MISSRPPASQNAVEYTAAPGPFAQVRGEQGVDKPQHQPQHPQPGVPQPEHRRRPAVRDQLPGRLPAKNLNGSGSPKSRGISPAPAARIRPGPPTGLALRSLPGQVDGARAGGVPGRSSTGLAAMHAFAVAVAHPGLHRDGGPHLDQHTGHHPVRPVDPLDLPAAGVTITVAVMSSWSVIRAAARNACTLAVISHPAGPAPPGIAHAS